MGGAVSTDGEAIAGHLGLLREYFRPLRVTTPESSRIKKLGTKYGLSLPSASRVRKIGATSVALHLGNSTQAHLVTMQMSHSVNTDAQYYQAIVGDSHAMSAFKSMTELRNRRADSSTCSEVGVTEQKSGELQRRRAFTAEETRVVMLYFKEHIAKRQSASLSECKDFLGVHPHQKHTRQGKESGEQVRVNSRHTHRNPLLTITYPPIILCQPFRILFAAVTSPYMCPCTDRSQFVLYHQALPPFSFYTSQLSLL